MMRLVNIARKYKGLSLGGIKAKFDSVDKTISLPTIVKLLGGMESLAGTRGGRFTCLRGIKKRELRFAENF